MSRLLLMLVLLVASDLTFSQQRSLGATAAEKSAPFRGQIGRRITYVCPADVSMSAALWGTDVYSDDSPICLAAIHAGVLAPGRVGAVTFVIGGGVASLQGSTRNGVTSRSYGSHSASLTFDRNSTAGQIDWTTTGQGLPALFTTPVVVSCPPQGSPASKVWGTDVYTEDSSICAAAVHAGVILSAAAGGRVAVLGAPGQSSYVASNRNGVPSQAYGALGRSFRLEAAPEAERLAGVSRAAESAAAGAFIGPAPVMQSATATVPAPAPSEPSGAFIGPAPARRSVVAGAPPALPTPASNNAQPSPPRPAFYIGVRNGTFTPIDARADLQYRDAGSVARCAPSGSQEPSRSYVHGLGYVLRPIFNGSPEVLFGLELLGMTITNAAASDPVRQDRSDAVVDVRNAHLTLRGEIIAYMTCVSTPAAPRIESTSIYPVNSGQVYQIRCPASYQLVGGAFRKTAGLHPIAFAPGQDAQGTYWKLAFHVLDRGLFPSVAPSAICVPEGTFTGHEVISGQPVALGPRGTTNLSLRCPPSKKMLSAGLDASASPAPHGYLASRLAPFNAAAANSSTAIDVTGWTAVVHNREVIGHPSGVRAVMSGICVDAR